MVKKAQEKRGRGRLLVSDGEQGLHELRRASLQFVNRFSLPCHGVGMAPQGALAFAATILSG